MNKIHIAGYGSMFYFIYRSTFITICLPMLLKYKADSLIICILGSILGFFIFLGYLYLLNKNKEDNIILFIDHNGKRKFGYFINTLLCILILCFSFFLMHNLLSFIQFEYLKDTPLYILYILLGGTLLYMASKDFETISKASLIFFLFSILFFFIKTFGLFGNINIENIRPFLEITPIAIISASIKYAIYTTVPLFLLLLISKKEIEPQKNIIKKTKWFYAITSLILFIHLFLIISVMGSYTASIYFYPEFHLLSNINILGFIDKLESILSIQWIIDMIICISLCFIYVKTYLLHYIYLFFPKIYDKINPQNDNDK